MSASDSDDDKPLMELIKKRKAQVSAEAISNGQKKKEKEDTHVAKKVKVEPPTNTSSKKSAAVKEEKSASSAKTTSTAKSTPSRSSSSNSGQYCADFYETDKGMMVQRLLCRWWYAITWPRPEDIRNAPPGYEALDGFPGVFICTSSDSLGKIIDSRNKETCPSLKNIAQWSSERIQETCMKAYEEQMRILAEVEGEDSSLYRTLKKEYREVKKINPAAADREARKYDFSNR